MSNSLRILCFSLIISIVLISIIFIIPKSRKYLIKTFKEDFAFMILFLTSIMAISLVNYIILTELSLKEEKTQRVNVIETEKEIVSLNFKQEINGSIDGNFILGIGSVDGNINNESYFYFYTKENNRYKLEKIEREKVELEETNEVNPKIVYRKFEDVEDIIKTPTQIGELLGLKFEKETINLDTISNRFMGFYKGSRKSETVLYIPVGSIVENFNPNVE